MRYFPLWHSPFAYLIIGAVCAHTTGSANPKDGPPSKKEAEPAAIEIKQIELSKIYSTSGQSKLKDVRESVPDDTAGRKALRALEDTLMASKSGPLIGIVRGESIAEAVIASGRLVGMKKSPKNVVGPDEKSISSKHWLFVYLGTKHSSPLGWVVYPAQKSGTRFRFSYSDLDSWPYEPDPAVTLDFLAYLYWAPLGELKDSSEADAELILIEKAIKTTFPRRQ